MTSTGIVASDVTRSFGQVQAVRGATFVAEPGRVTGLVGPNGAGKTTLLLMLASLLRPDSGTISIHGVDPVEDPAAARSILGWMPDALGAWGALTARETLVMTGRLYGMTKADAGARADALLDHVGLGPLAGAPARVLSRGQKQRLGLARALVHDPQVLLLDEPASGLDPQARIDLRRLLRGFAAAGRTVLVSSHVLAELEELVDDAVFLRDGTSVAAPSASAAVRPWRLRVWGEPPTPVAFAAALGRRPQDIGRDRDAFVVGFAGEADAAHGLRAILDAGIAVTEFAPAVGRLEQAFMDLRPGEWSPRIRGGGRVNASRLWTITVLELTQRVRSVAWYVLLGVFAVILLGVTVLSFVAFGMWSGTDGPGGAIYSVIVYMVLLLVLLVAPTVAGNAVNGDRESATLAAVQVTRATTAEIVFGKLLAAWVTGLAFLAVAVPFLIAATIAGGVAPASLAVSLLVLILEIGIFAAIGVGLSALLARPLFSVASTYLVMAAFVVGTLIVFGLGGISTRTEVTTSSRWGMEYDMSGGVLSCSPWETYTTEVPRFDRVWWVFAANPFVVIADATPTVYDRNGYTQDLFGQIASGVRLAQIPPETEVRNDGCENPEQPYPSTQEQTAGLAPSWFVGLGVQLVVAGLLFWGGYRRTRTPARSLPPGTRVA